MLKKTYAQQLPLLATIFTNACKKPNITPLQKAIAKPRRARHCASCRRRAPQQRLRRRRCSTPMPSSTKRAAAPNKIAKRDADDAPCFVSLVLAKVGARRRRYRLATARQWRRHRRQKHDVTYFVTARDDAPLYVSVLRFQQAMMMQNTMSRYFTGLPEAATKKRMNIMTFSMASELLPA